MYLLLVFLHIIIIIYLYKKLTRVFYFTNIALYLGTYSLNSIVSETIVITIDPTISIMLTELPITLIGINNILAIGIYESIFVSEVIFEISLLITNK